MGGFMRTYPKLAMLVMLMDLLVTGMLGLGALFGYTVFPYILSGLVGKTEWLNSIPFRAPLPLWMPSIHDLNLSHTFLPLNNLQHLPLTMLASAVLIIVQSFIRGMYLGGISAVLQGDDHVALLSCGKYYFRRMLAWSGLQLASAGVLILAGMLFEPLVLLLLAFLFLFTLTPYLVVLLDCSLVRAIAMSPTLLLRNFGRFVGLALAAMLITFVISYLGELERPYNYYFAMLIYSLFGTGLIAEFMRLLRNSLRKDRGLTLHMPKLCESRAKLLLSLLAGIAVFILPLAGVWLAEGSHLRAFQKLEHGRVEGVSFSAAFSAAYRDTGHKYTSYTWGEESFGLDIHLPQLESGVQPEEIRGIAHIQWEVNQEVIVRMGNYSSSWVEPATRVDQLYYRLKKQQSKDGSVYYSTLGGSAGIIGANSSLYERLSVDMMISGDGKHIFVGQYPTHFYSSLSFLSSDNGRFLIPRASEINPNHFKYYWFSNEMKPEDIFQMLSAKNTANWFERHYGIDLLLAVALQEADGEMVIRLLDRMKQHQVKLEAPHWNADQWTEYLRSLYRGADLMEMLAMLTRAGELDGFKVELEPATEPASRTKYRISIPFPNGKIALHTWKEDNELQELTIELSALGGDVK
jgi:hypothetical protein